MKHQAQEQPNYNYDQKRFETFIDAVIAIILTILVLELRVPENMHSENISTKEQLSELLPSFISYIGSFLLIAGIWIDHHIMFLNLTRLTKRFILLNFLFILSLSVVPFTTAFAGNNYHDSFAVALLFCNYFLMNLFFALLYWYSNWKGIINPAFIADNKKTGIYSSIGIAGLIAAIPLAYVNTYISFALGIIIFTGHLFKKK
ncbi:MAG: TMEM175 family protein [Bacteroidota bacterium]